MIIDGNVDGTEIDSFTWPREFVFLLHVTLTGRPEAGSKLFWV